MYSRYNILFIKYYTICKFCHEFESAHWEENWWEKYNKERLKRESFLVVGVFLIRIGLKYGGLGMVGKMVIGGGS